MYLIRTDGDLYKCNNNKILFIQIIIITRASYGCTCSDFRKKIIKMIIFCSTGCLVQRRKPEMR